MASSEDSYADLDLLEPIPLERRACERTLATGSVMALFQHADGSATLAPAEMIDAGSGGIGIRCSVDVPPGTRALLYPMGMPVARGVGMVARCTREGSKYRVGLMYEANVAA